MVHRRADLPPSLVSPYFRQTLPFVDMTIKGWIWYQVRPGALAIACSCVYVHACTCAMWGGGLWMNTARNQLAPHLHLLSCAIAHDFE